MMLGTPALSLLSCARSVLARPPPLPLLGLPPTTSTAIRSYVRMSKSTPTPSSTKSTSTSASKGKGKGKGKGTPIVDRKSVG